MQSASAYASKAMMKQEAMSSSTLQASAKSASMSSSREETTETITRSSASSATAKKVQMMQAEQRARMLEVSQRASSQQRSSRREEAQVQSLRAADIKVNSSEDTWRFLQNPVSQERGTFCIFLTQQQCIFKKKCARIKKGGKIFYILPLDDGH